MQSEFDERLEAILCQAVEIESAQQRVLFLDEACTGDAALRASVDKLIHNHFAAGSFLEHPGIGATMFFDETTGPPDDSASTEDVPLGFLDPSEEPGSLGQLGRYEILEVVGRGGMGIVLKARDTNLQRIVAVKVLASELAANATARKRFLREAQAAAAMSDNHIVTIYAVEENRGSHESSDQAPLPFLVMEFIDGLSLQEKLNQQGPLELKEILRIGRQIASGLAAAHQQGLIHRDIKPANILLQNGVQRVQITDFGLARAVDDVGMTRTGEVTGTPMYMSPEQAMGQSVDERSDLFSLGSVLYAMCTGRAPFRAETTIAVLRRVCDETPRPVRDVTPEIPESLAALIDRLLEKDPDQRFQSAREVADLLRKQLANLQTSNASPKAATVVPAERRTNFSRRQKAWLMAGSILFVLAASLGVTEATGVTHFSATVVRIVTGEGTLVIEVDDPAVKVTVEGDGGLVITGAGPQEVRLRPGSYEVHAVKDGKPVPIDRELITITRGGKQVVRVRIESPPSPSPLVTVPAPTEPTSAPFVVLTGKGIRIRPFATLAKAVAATHDGDIIEVRGNGPFVTTPIVIRRPLTIRAGAGFCPVIKADPDEQGAILLDNQSSLALEGLDFQWLDAPPFEQAKDVKNMVLCRWATSRLHVANCRFLMNRREGAHTRMNCIAVWTAALFQVRNCQFVVGGRGTGSIGASVSFSGSPQGEVLVDNCLMIGQMVGSAIFPTQSKAVLKRNTCLTPQFVKIAYYTKIDPPGEEQTSPPLQVQASANIFDGRFVFRPDLLADEKVLTATEAENILKKLAAWSEHGNLYLLPNDKDLLYLESIFPENSAPVPSILPTKTMADWKRFWGMQELDSQRGQARFQGGDLATKAEHTPDLLTPEDFRLRPDSAGYRAGPDGKDLGADVDLVGPGPAYERWKTTPEYQEWLKETGQAK